VNIIPIGCDNAGAYLAAFNALMLDTFDISFEHWHRQGHWTQDYTCYAIIEDDCMISNAGVYRMEMLVSSKPQTCFQIGGVATRKGRQGEGLSRKVMDYILGLHPEAAFFLCANHSVLNFYPKFGFHPLVERQPWIQYRLKLRRPGMTRLDIHKDQQKIDAYLQRRTQFSKILDCTNAAPIYWFSLLLALSNHLYEIPDCGVMLVAEQEGDILTLYDVCASEPVCFSDIAPHLAFDGVREIRFGFNPDWLGIEYQYRKYQDEDSILFVRGELQLPAEFILPMLIRT